MRITRKVCGAALALAAAGCTHDAAGPGVLARLSGEPGDFDYIVNPPHVQVSPGTTIPNAVPFCKISATLTLICYPPSLVRAAYNFPSNLDGTGQTIVIVDAFGSPTIQQDLARFDQAFGIPDPPSFTILCPQGCPTFAPNNAFHAEVGWSIETSLDVEYAHAMAPGAKIVLVVASTSSGNAINSAEAAAIKLYPGSIISQSFGIPEILVHGNNAQILQAHQNYQAALAAGITVLASTGDLGATNGFQTANASFPASDPLVTAVGGTQGDPYPGGLAGCSLTAKTCTGTYGGEQVWNEPASKAATGGAPSFLFGVPSYQNGLTLNGSPLTTRTTPDVSYNAAVDGGVLVAWSAIPSQAGFYIVGGTSAGSPQWAAIVALANQCKGAPLGFITPTLYTIMGLDFHDITVGNNQLVGTPVGFSAGTGWDGASGLGTPKVTSLVQDLAGGACL